MSPNKIICGGGAGSVVVALCCFTPILAVALPAIGLAAWLGWIDYVLFPVLAGLLGVTAYGFYLRRNAAVSSGAADVVQQERCR